VAVSWSPTGATRSKDSRTVRNDYAHDLQNELNPVSLSKINIKSTPPFKN
jgi:hypothetical protein